jgi:hypothetical protein
MRLTFRHDAPFRQTFREHAFDHMVGQSITVKIPGQPPHGTVVSAEVIDGGKAVQITLDTDPQCQCGESR